MATNEQLRLVIDVATRNAIQALDDMQKAANDTGAELDDTRTAAEKLADAISSEADRLISDLKASENAANALGDALGPELRQSIGQAKIDSFIGDLKRAGLSFEEVEQSADQFAAALKKMDAAKASVNDVQGAMRRLGGETDNSRSVFANFAGNAVQELPGLADAFGPLNMAVSQFTEYATEGNIHLSEMGKFVGPIAGVTAAMWALNKGSEQAAAAEKRLTEAFNELSRATDRQALASFTKIMLDGVIAGKNLNDVIHEMAATNIEGTRRLVDLMEQQGASTAQTKLLRDAIADEERAAKQAEQTHKKYGDAANKAADAQERVKGNAGGVSGALHDIAAMAAAAADEAWGLSDALRSIGGGSGGISGAGPKTPDGERRRSSATSSAAPVNVTIHTGADPKSVIRAVKDYTRKGGVL